MVHFRKGYVRQFTSGLVVSFSSLGFGMAVSWISMTEPILRSKESPVGPLTDSEISWLGSLPSLGAIFGALFWSRIINCVGRKNAAILTTVPFLISHTTYVFANNFYVLLIPRFFVGTGVVGTMLNTPGYIAEICEEKIKSNVSSILMIIVNFSTFMMYVLGTVCNYYYFNVIITIIPLLIATLIVLCTPESPVYLMKVKQDEKAKEQLKWLRATTDAVLIDSEFNRLKENFLNINDCSKTLKLSEIWNSSYYFKSLIFGLILQSTISMSGIGMMTTYQNNVLQLALVRPNTSEYAILLAASQCIGAFLSFFMFHKFNRKVFVIGCNSTVGVCLLSSAILLYLRSIHVYTVNPMIFIPIFCIYCFVHGLGLSTVVYTVVPELYAVECRNTFASSLLFLHFSLHYVITKLYPILVNQIHLYGWLFIFSFYSLFAALFGLFILPETKGKSIQYIFSKISKNKTLDAGYTKTHKSQISTVS